MISMRHLVGTCAVVLLLSISGLGAAGSDVADAVMRGDTAAVRALLAQKADVNATQADGATALHWAVYPEDLGHDRPADSGGRERQGGQPRGLRRRSRWPCLNGNAAIVESLLKAGADPNEKLPNGETPLMMASRTGNVAAMTALLDRGADVNAKETLRGTTALMWAADQGHAAAVQLLIERGADMQARSNAHGPGDPGKRRGWQGRTDPTKKRNRALQAWRAGRSRRRSLRRQPGTPAAVRQAPDLSGGALTPLGVRGARQLARHGQDVCSPPAPTSIRPPDTAGRRCSWRRRTASISSART